MNKEQRWYLRAGFGFSIPFIILILILSLFDITRQFIPISFTAFVTMWCITLINVLIFKDTKKSSKPKLRTKKSCS